MRRMVSEFDLDVRVQILADTKNPPPPDIGATLTCPRHLTCGGTCGEATCADSCNGSCAATCAHTCWPRLE